MNIDIIDACFFCTTPFQLITAISLVATKGITADLYIDPRFNNAKEYAQRVNNSHLFRKIIILDDSFFEDFRKIKGRCRRYIEIVKMYFSIDKVVARILCPNTQYLFLYISTSSSFWSRYVMLYFNKKNIATETIFFEDGEGSYDDANMDIAKSIDTMIRKVLFGKKAIYTSCRVLLYSPPIYWKINPNSSYNVEQLPTINSEKIKKIINYIFNFREKDYISESIIILDTVKEEFFSKEESKKLTDIYKTICKVFGNENVIIKRHPRDKETCLPNIKYYQKFTIPFECLCTQNDFEHKILIAFTSTSVIVPKIIFNEEPIVILLYKLFESGIGHNEKRDMLYSECKMLYKDSERFIVPSTVDELYQVLNEFKRTLFKEK